MRKLYSTFANMKLLVQSIQPTGKTHSGTVIFLHGSGDTGSNLVEWIRFLIGKDLQFQHLKVIIPTAPVQPYTPLDGEPSHVWFDRLAISKKAKECRTSMEAAYEYVNELIQTEKENGIPPNRIVIGGFSMGGALALHTALHVNRELAGVFTCSSFLNDDSLVFESLRSNQQNAGSLPNLLMYHGERDSLVPMSWGKETYDELLSLGVTGEFKTLKNALHELKANELLEIQEWISKLVPPLESDIQNKL
ncbi:lysophospholipase-like protein 1 [Sitodiplosis mosellana]|uniref:lysophospholipase-like protein 1 n=1 Tax=Sitodiplosis mosellana TaxID=263140 RepID=UPI0024442A88|nr:lysophospholipase-like protein 1 [Sitodiplosis mosellana]